MIHYHGTPVGGTNVDAARFLMGRHALVPFKYPGHFGEALEVCQSVILDNSAYSFWRAGQGEVPVAGYRAWVESVSGHPSVDWCLIPDKIDGTEEENRDLVYKWIRSGCSVKSVPVWHLHESIDWLVELAESFETVALGSSGQYATPGTPAWWQRIGEAMDGVCDHQGRPLVKLHGLRMLNPKIFTYLPLSSADSTNATVNNGRTKRFGMYPAPTAAGRSAVIADRIEAHNSADRWVGIPKQESLFGEHEQL